MCPLLEKNYVVFPWALQIMIQVVERLSFPVKTVGCSSVPSVGRISRNIMDKFLAFQPSMGQALIVGLIPQSTPKHEQDRGKAWDLPSHFGRSGRFVATYSSFCWSKLKYWNWLPHIQTPIWSDPTPPSKSTGFFPWKTAETVGARLRDAGAIHGFAEKNRSMIQWNLCRGYLMVYHGIYLVCRVQN